MEQLQAVELAVIVPAGVALVLLGGYVTWVKGRASGRRRPPEVQGSQDAEHDGTGAEGSAIPPRPPAAP